MNHPDRAVALLRVVVGAWFVKAVWTKVSYGVVAGVIPYPMVSPRFIAFHPKRVAEFAAGNPIGWYRDFLQTTVLPHAELFATLQTIGEVVVGVGLLLGVMTRLAAAVGLFLALNFGLANQWMSFGQQGFHLLLVVSMAIFLVTGAGRVWGLDGWLLARTKRLRILRWLAALLLIAMVPEAHAEVRVYDKLFTRENPSDTADGQDFTANLNPKSLEILTGCKVEPSVADVAPGARFQFERLGYFCVDRVDARPGALVFNRAVTLRDTWAKIEKAQQQKK